MVFTIQLERGTDDATRPHLWHHPAGALRHAIFPLLRPGAPYTFDDFANNMIIYLLGEMALVLAPLYWSLGFLFKADEIAHDRPLPVYWPGYPRGFHGLGCLGMSGLSTSLLGP